MFDLFHYSFIIRGFEAGIIVAIIAPLIGIFLVLRRYSLIADTFAHVSLGGIALGLFLGWNPVLTALIVTCAASLGIDRLRTSKKVYGESALAIFLSGSLAFAVVLLSLAKGFNTNLFSYLFGSITTVAPSDVTIIAILGIVVISTLVIFMKELISVTFDEEFAKVSGIRVKLVNIIFILLTALTVSLSIPIVGILLISALIVLPVVTALQFKKSFLKTIIYAEIVSIFSVISGIIASFYLNLSTGGTIVLIMVVLFILALLRNTFSVNETTENRGTI
ncbi:MAG: metal ABC transporter permease [Candidatus Pacebacteria bacterium]|nr:metal ABC transporter permease [Candidatus Paceibacterota bacterium]